MWRVTGVCWSLLCLVTSSLGDGGGYGAPEPAGYQPSYDGYSAVGSAEPDLTPILIGILVLTGLALLFPSYVTLSSVRRKRSVGAGQGKRSSWWPSTFQPWYPSSSSPPWQPQRLLTTFPLSIPTASIRGTVVLIPPPLLHPTGPRNPPTPPPAPHTRHLLLPTAPRGIDLKSSPEMRREESKKSQEIHSFSLDKTIQILITSWP